MSSTHKKVIVVGATGEIGRALSRRLLQDQQYGLVVFSRTPKRAREIIPGAVEYVEWQPEENGTWVPAIDSAYAIVNLAGAPSFGVRWTAEYRRALQENRMTIARGLVNAIRLAKTKPQIFVQGSSVGTYGFTTVSNRIVDEDTPLDDDSFTQESLKIEQEAQKAEELDVRTVVLRTGFVLDKNDGGLPLMVQSIRRFTGGILLPGTQWLPWIHIDDEVGIILKALEDEQVRGPVNMTAPEVVTNRDCMKTIGGILHRPIPMRVPRFLLQMFMGDSAAILTRGKRIVPKRMLTWGYVFQYPSLKDALNNLLN